MHRSVTIGRVLGFTTGADVNSRTNYVVNLHNPSTKDAQYVIMKLMGSQARRVSENDSA